MEEQILEHLREVIEHVEQAAKTILELTIQNDQYRGMLTFVARRTVDDWAREQCETALKNVPLPEPNEGGPGGVSV